jgi:hypothetical protein
MVVEIFLAERQAVPSLTRGPARCGGSARGPEDPATRGLVPSLELLKIGAVIWRNTRRIRFCLSSSCPDRHLFAPAATPQRVSATPTTAGRDRNAAGIGEHDRPARCGWAMTLAG